MDENRKGPGVFYAVMGVATLVVAIVGATFAYFAATVEPDETITGTTAAAGSLKLTVTRVTGDTTATNMVPMRDADLQTGVTGTDETSCVDAKGNTVCQVYSITIKNEGAAAVAVGGTLALDNGGATNMRWQVIENATTVGTGGTAVTVTDATALGANVDLAGNGEKTYHVVVWLSETGAPQQATDAGKTFNGTVSFTAVGANGNTGITATFAA